MKVLLVDDEVEIRHIVKLNISAITSDVNEASDGLEAFVQCCQEKFDVIVTDFKMPEVDGLQLIRYLKTKPNLNSSTAIIFVSSYIPEFRNELKHFDKVLFLPKPIEFKKLQNYLSLSLAAV